MLNQKTLNLSLLLVFMVGWCIQPVYALEPLNKNEMSNVTGREGLDLQFNLELGSSFDPMALSIQDGDGDENDTTDYTYIGIEGLWFTMGVTGSDNIGIDVYNETDIGSYQGVVRLSMDDGESITGIEGGIERVQMKYNIRGCCGNNVLGLQLDNGSGSGGSVNFDGNFNIFDL